MTNDKNNTEEILHMLKKLEDRGAGFQLDLNPTATFALMTYLPAINTGNEKVNQLFISISKAMSQWFQNEIRRDNGLPPKYPEAGILTGEDGTSDQ